MVFWQPACYVRVEQVTPCNMDNAFCHQGKEMASTEMQKILTFCNVAYYVSSEWYWYTVQCKVIPSFSMWNTLIDDVSQPNLAESNGVWPELRTKDLSWRQKLIIMLKLFGMCFRLLTAFELPCAEHNFYGSTLPCSWDFGLWYFYIKRYVIFFPL